MFTPVVGLPQNVSLDLVPGLAQATFLLNGLGPAQRASVDQFLIFLPSRAGKSACGPGCYGWAASPLRW
jgi:hypothetical protein